MTDYIAQPPSDYTHTEWRASLIDESKPYPEHGWVRTVTYSPWREATEAEAPTAINDAGG